MLGAVRASRRALIGGLSVLLPAAGIAYLGAVSYTEERGILAARLEEQRAAARSVAESVEAEIASSLDQVASLFSSTDGRPSPPARQALAVANPLAERPFLIGRGGMLVFPAARPLRSIYPAAAPDRILATQRPCPERGLLSCVKAMRAARKRQADLAEARRLEMRACLGTHPECRADARSAAEARRRYQSLTRFEDTGPAALLALARMAHGENNTAAAAAHYAELGERFRDAVDDDEMPYGLIADLGRVTVASDPTRWLAMYRRLLDREYRAPVPALEAVVDQLRHRLAQSTLSPEAGQQLAKLDERLEAARRESRFAEALASEVEEVGRAAELRVRGRQARGSRDTIAYRRQPDGSVVGVVVARADLTRIARRADAELQRIAQSARAAIVGVGESSEDERTRTLASVGFGEALPHLNLELVNDRSRPDPLDEIVRSRGLRHLGITGGLVAILVLGLVATIRGAARERQLARLQSDFVSTVSHELKTPLTSIRMFAEMLQQDVAGSDRDRERRYHDIIVKESERLGLLIANLLDYSQIEKGTRRYSQRREPARDVLEEAVATFQRMREEAKPNIEISIAPEAQAIEVVVDRDVVVQALLNLLANAAKYAGDAHPIRATLTMAGGNRVAFGVSDRGPGIPKTEQARIFREFYRTPEAYSSGVEGTGLGLALVKRHVEAQGGEVALDSAVGKGSTFSLLFSPYADSAPA
jgi:signal transduction histidine kinase